MTKSSLAVAGGLLLPSIVPSSVFGAKAPSNRINIGMIGMGRQAYHPNLTQFLEAQDAQVVAVCDVDSWRMEQGLQKVNQYYSEAKGKSFKGCSSHEDFRDLLERNDIDAVMISTPDHWHVPMGIMAARAGKDFSVEKPLSTHLAGGRALVDAVKRHKIISRTDSEFRSLKPFWRAAELVRNGRIGELHTIHAGVPFDMNGEVPPAQPTMPVPEELNYDRWLGPAPFAPYTEKRVHNRKEIQARPGWMRISDYCNGMISNWGTHLLDIAQWANNTEYTGPVEVEGTGEFTTGLWNTVNSFKLRYRYENGVQLLYKTENPYIRFEGSEGWVQVEYPDKITASSASILDTKKNSEEVNFASTKEDKRDFLDAVKNRTKTLEPVEVGHRVVSICQIGLIAIKLGRKLHWDPESEEFKNDNAANAMKYIALRSPWSQIFD
ncbi:Gfo/Idh/MocA family protein [Autumnicola edwardsiae]|uniref:Gfo/Idh/MocA family oxidoreductase n=1 Tax=Autumnicola edwardsiae TaxID=3075594 RepID=A0ABU3CWB1_9FLAO|nr:Gfo/Idh/MocA family oxidoreductase [Zunongwangia sp. F297]MDT0650634.1 Gfo/Idh/MocA family oxidoreductase [Zunongwangia sp. F297]